ncbi:MAG: aldehyde-activating protein [Kordiimonadales bacterium]|nr:MAG: aldehyde-activating protein [Kordiimonadales bacterium]
MATLVGSCYCGNITVNVTTDVKPAEMTPRLCDCDFCTAHGIEWVSTPNAALEIEIQNEAAINLYSQGSESARFWICQRCGVVPAVTCDIEGHRKGAVNKRAMIDRDAFPATEPVSPKNLPPEEKKARWDNKWIDTVTVKDCWDVGL